MTDQDDLLADFYEGAFDAFGAAGMSYRAVYQSDEGADPVPCTVLSSRDLQSLGEYARVSAARAEFGMRKAEVGTPVEGAIVTIGVTSYVLESLVSDDEAFARWVVGRG